MADPQTTMPAMAEMFSALDRRLNNIVETIPSRGHVTSVEVGLQELKMLLLESLRGKDGSTLKDLPSSLVNLNRQLTVMGIDEAQITKLMQYLRSLPTPEEQDKTTPEAQADYYRNQAIRWMLKRVRIAPKWSAVPGSVSYHALVGPPGAGKTSTVAKLAAHYHLREKAKVLLVSWDNYRLAAPEQLRVYAKIIGVPFVVVSDPEELKVKMREFKDIEVVLIDTAGRNPRNPEQLKDLETLRKSILSTEMHLVLSVTDKESHLDQAIRQFAPTGLQSLLFTKLDTSWSFGEIYNLSLKWSLPLSFFAVGQEVPEDLERATRERVVERIFGV